MIEILFSLMVLSLIILGVMQASLQALNMTYDAFFLSYRLVSSTVENDKK